MMAISLSELSVPLNALMYAAEKGHIKIVRMLVEAEADVDDITTYVTRENKTALMWASERGHIDIARFLLEAGASSLIRNREGKSALTYALNKSHTEIVSLLQLPIPNTVISK